MSDREIKLLSLSNSSIEFGRYIIIPQLKLYLVQLGATAAHTGMFSIIANSVPTMSQPLFGWLIDILHKPRLILIVGSISASLTVLLISLSNTIETILTDLLLLMISLSILQLTLIVLLGILTDRESRGKHTSPVMMASSLSSIIALLAGSLVFQGEVRSAIFYAVILSSLAFLFSGISIYFAKLRPSLLGFSLLKEFKIGFKDIKYRRFLFLNFFTSFSLSTIWPIVPFILVGRVGIGLGEYPLLLLSSNLVSLVAYYKVGDVLDKVGRKPVMILSKLMLIAVPPAFLLVSDFYQTLLLYIFIGFPAAFERISTNVYTIDVTREEVRGSLSSIVNFLSGVGILLGTTFTSILSSILLTYDLDYILYTMLASFILRGANALLHILFLQETSAPMH